jgi:tRNA-splicing ligase RtcB
MKLVLSQEQFPIKLWLDDLEEGAEKQARNIANLPFIHKWVALMPDAHAGKGIPIGSVIATDGVLIPYAIGVDIACGMLAIKTDIKNIDKTLYREKDPLKIAMGIIRKTIPTGFEHHKENQVWEGFDKVPNLPICQKELKSARKQLGTLGGGNHFIEFQEDKDLNLWIMIHSGSRNFGLQVAEYYHKKAWEFFEKYNLKLPDKFLAYLPVEDPVGQEYLKAMNFCMDFAYANRAHMMNAVLQIMNDNLLPTSKVKEINIHHNYAALENHYGKDVWVHRKGATRSCLGEVGIIPGSMGSPSYIVEGLGNPESFMSCSHGAGRNMSRTKAIKTLNLADEQAKMSGILHGLRNIGDLDEAPSAYKDISQVMKNQEDLVKIQVELFPKANIKGDSGKLRKDKTSKIGD